MSKLSQYTRYRFQGYSRYIITPHSTGHGLVAVRHTALDTPWVDPDVHTHQTSEEYYFLLQGELRFWVAEASLTLRPNEILMVRPQVPHAIVSGEGAIEHFGIRAPAPDDRLTVGEIPPQLPPATEEHSRELRRDWGYRIPLEDARNRNCWLIGFGSARFPSAHLILAYLDLTTAEAASAGIGTRHRLHVHKESWEYYAVLQGTKTLLIEDETVTIQAGEILEVPQQVKHTLCGRQAPYLGFTFRVPVADDKVEC
jgi:mannose-6-phosphate isomerase-like protein (cupin superfamily)